MKLTHWPLGDFSEILDKQFSSSFNSSMAERSQPSEIALWWLSLDVTDDKSTLVQVMAWCRQATSHYLNQCWPRSLSLYGITRPQWVKISYEPTNNWWYSCNKIRHNNARCTLYGKCCNSLFAAHLRNYTRHICLDMVILVLCTGFTSANWVIKPVCTDVSMCTYW